MSGCQSLSQPPKTDTVVVEQDKNLVCNVPFDPEIPDGFVWQDLKFKVLTPEIMFDIINDENYDGEIVFFALSVDEYEKLSYNVSNLKRVLEQNRLLLFELIDYYKTNKEE